MLSQMQVFNEYVQPNIIETIDQMVEKFNAASGGSISLTTQGVTGDFLQRSMFKSIHGNVRDVDRYSNNDDVTGTNLEALKESGVKFAAGIGPLVYEPSQMTWLQKPTATGIEVMSSEIASAIMQKQLNTIIAALVAAIANQADVTHDVSGTPEPITYGVLNTSHAKFGDNSSAIVAQVMTGAMFHRLIGQNLTNANRLFDSSGVQVVDILGKLIVVTDSPALLQAGKDYVLGLTSQAATVSNGSDVVSNIETRNFKKRIETSLQIDFSFVNQLKGYTWDEAGGGKSPDSATIATGTNWDRTATSHKHTAGVVAIGAA